MPRGERARSPVMSRPRQRIRPDFTGRMPASASKQLRLAVAGDAGDPDDLARAAPRS